MSAVRKLSEFHPMITDERSSGNGHYVVVRHFEHADHAEASAIRLDHTDSLKRGGGAQRKNDDKLDMSFVALKKSQARARRTIRHKSFAIQCDRMLTLTFKENITDLDEAWGVFKYFNKLMTHRYGERYQYIAVPEFQKRGAVHFHLALSGYYSIKVIRHFWTRATGLRGGNPDITNPNKFGKNSWNPTRIAQYLAKYISKNDSVEFNKKRYSSTRNIILPEPMKAWIPMCLGAHIHVLTSVIEKLCHNPVQTLYETDDGMFPIVFVST